jgi:hypothetical protein
VQPHNNCPGSCYILIVSNKLSKTGILSEFSVAAVIPASAGFILLDPRLDPGSESGVTVFTDRSWCPKPGHHQDAAFMHGARSESGYKVHYGAGILSEDSNHGHLTDCAAVKNGVRDFPEFLHYILNAPGQRAPLFLL